MRKLIQVILENFQSWEYAVFDIANTLTIFTGESDNGKTAIERCLFWICENEPRKADFRMVGKDFCRGTLVYDDGVQVIREMTKSKNLYIIRRPGMEDKELSGFGINVPEEVRQITGIRRLKVDLDDKGKGLSLNFMRQLAGPFGICENDYTKARMIGHLTRTHLFDISYKRAKADFERAEGEVKELSKRLAELDDSLKEYEDLPVLEETITRLEGIYNALLAAETRYKEIEILSANLSDVCEKIKEQVELQERLKNVPVAESALGRFIAAATDYEEAFAAAEALAEDEANIRKAQEVLGLTKDVDVAEKHLGAFREAGILYKEVAALYAALNTVIESINESEEVLRRTEDLWVVENVPERLEELTAQISEVEVLVSGIKDLEQKICECEHVLKTVEGISKAGESLKKLQDIYSRGKEVALLYEQLKNDNQKIAEASAALNKATTELEELSTQYAALLKDAGKCPICKTTVSEGLIGHLIDELVGQVA